MNKNHDIDLLVGNESINWLNITSPVYSGNFFLALFQSGASVRNAKVDRITSMLGFCRCLH